MDMDYRKQIARAASLIRSIDGFFGLTGAGLSTESGIPDFRTPGKGIWEKVDPIKTSTVDVLQNDPRLFYEVGFTRFASITMAEPNQGHHALARMEEMGFLKGLVTQNIDGLHVKAGSRNVWEVHGHLRTGFCQDCKKKYPFEEMVHQVELKRIPPVCHECSGVLRPDVVLFGDPMPPLFFEAEKVLRQDCDLMLVAGSSLVVYPVASLPRLAKQLIIINLTPTEYDRFAAVVIREKCGKALHDLAEELAGD
jgi:NAD-dependent deacetylase